MSLPQITATVHRVIVGWSAVLAAVIAGVTALDTDALGVSPELKATAIAVLTVINAVTTVLRSQTDRQ